MTANPQTPAYDVMTPNGPGLRAGTLFENGTRSPIVRHWRTDMIHRRHGRCLLAKKHVESDDWEQGLWAYEPEEVKPL